MALTGKQAKALQLGDKPVFDGKVTGLLLLPGKTGSKWTLRFTSPISGKRRDAGLGVYPEVTIADARDKALAKRRQLDAGKDPIDERNREQEAARVAAAPTFEKVARQVHEELKPGWRDEKHGADWIRSLEAYVFPNIGAKALDAVTPADCADVLRPIWLEKAETASRTHQPMHAVMQWGWAHGHITANPVSVVDHLLPKQNAKKEHQPTMPCREIPAFVQAQLRDSKPGESTRAAMLFTILTAARSGEVRGATWSEFDLEAGIWTIPGERMKAKETHRVPLSSQALELVKRLKEQKQYESKVDETQEHPSALLSSHLR
jgi:integrase